MKLQQVQAIMHYSNEQCTRLNSCWRDISGTGKDKQRFPCDPKSLHPNHFITCSKMPTSSLSTRRGCWWERISVRLGRCGKEVSSNPRCSEDTSSHQDWFVRRCRRWRAGGRRIWWCPPPGPPPFAKRRSDLVQLSPQHPMLFLMQACRISDARRRRRRRIPTHHFTAAARSSRGGRGKVLGTGNT